MNPLIAEIEKRQSADSRVNPLLWRAQELAALKLAVEALLPYQGVGADTEADVALRAIAEKLGVKP